VAGVFVVPGVRIVPLRRARSGVRWSGVLAGGVRAGHVVPGVRVVHRRGAVVIVSVVIVPVVLPARISHEVAVRRM
jgi:hypothetical protein